MIRLPYRRSGRLGRIREGDLFAADFRDATVVTLYLLHYLNAKLLPKLSQLKPGTRIVAHASSIPGIEPDQVVRFRSPDGLIRNQIDSPKTKSRS